jgi:hypothetical protein
MVTSQKMIENEMDYRGSKSDCIENILTNLSNKNWEKENLKIVSVKEQRVDGSYLGYKKKFFPKLRYTLMGCESNYQIKIPSKQLSFRNYSTFIQPIPVNPWF